MTSNTTTTSTVTETINSMDYNTGWQYSATGSGVSASGNLVPTGAGSTNTTNVTLDGVTSQWTGLNLDQRPNYTLTNQGAGLSIQRKLSWPRPIESHNNTENDNYTKRNRYNVNLHTIAKRLCLILASTVVSTPAYAADVGGVSATANPIANSSNFSNEPRYTSFTGPIYN